MDSMHGRMALSVLLIQDLVTIFFLLIVPELAQNASAWPIVEACLIAVGKLIGISLILIVGERLILRPLFKHAANNPESETLVLLAISGALGVSGITAAAGLSPALGAFLVGLLLGDAPYSDQVRAEIAPLRIGMLVLFFAYVGMATDLNWIYHHLLLVVSFTAAVMAGKTAIMTIILRLGKFTWRHALLSGLLISQLGEFSLVIAVLGKKEHLLINDYFQLIISTVLITIILTPALVSLGVDKLHRRNQDHDKEIDRVEKEAIIGHALIIGFGPAGQEVAYDLAIKRIPTLVVDLNLATKNMIKDRRIKFLHGDAARHEILQRANVDQADFVVITIPDATVAGQMVAQIRAIRSDIPIIVRCRHNRYYSKLMQADATHVIDEEKLMGESLSQKVLELAKDRPDTTHRSFRKSHKENQE